MKSLHANGKPLSDDSSKVCVLYDPKDGRVIHVHGVTILPGGEKVSDAELLERTIAHAKALGRSVQELKSLHLPLSVIGQPGTLKVDAKGTGLVASRAPARMRDVLADRRKAKVERANS